MMTFDQAFERLLGHEGGYVDHPSDPGGETNWGISHRSYPELDIKTLTQDAAKAIYRRDYWDRVRCDDLPDDLRFALFDAAVNSGTRRAVIWLQKAVDAEEDGVIGPETLQAVARAAPGRTVRVYNGQRLQFMASLPTWPRFGRGWANRIAENLMEA